MKETRSQHLSHRYTSQPVEKESKSITSSPSVQAITRERTLFCENGEKRRRSPARRETNDAGEWKSPERSRKRSKHRSVKATIGEATPEGESHFVKVLRFLVKKLVYFLLQTRSLLQI
ncbi:predicted protein [Arabidopsis lyrata subsp. lyrata]|uniref:Predicted protein n=1 Tax=Arabidopsis lyrata subsp. lyrata TaxID=81972 RepID=D7KWX0_ARALL|nr:predicted protein [Arabidopsis lyrata subsp. lyrata]